MATRNAVIDLAAVRLLPQAGDGGMSSLQLIAGGGPVREMRSPLCEVLE